MLALLLGCGGPTDADGDGDGVRAARDCDDDDPAVGAARAWYDDEDGDGFGAGTATTGCAAPAATVDNGLDCDDADAAVSPDAAERCDGRDSNCDGEDDAHDTLLYEDLDGDGFGTAGSWTCAGRAGYATLGADCDDANASVHAGGAEACGNGLDDDCSGGDEACSGWPDRMLADAMFSVTGDREAKYQDWRMVVDDFDGDGDLDLATGGRADPPFYDGPLVGSPVAAATISGEDFDGRWAIAGPGDLTGDGLPDLVFGVPGWAVPEEACYDYCGARGAAFVLAAPFSGPVDLNAGIRIEGADAQEEFGTEVATVGDENGDGQVDLLVADDWFTTVLIHGPILVGGASPDLAAATFYYTDSTAHYVGPGDADGDGLSDLVLAGYEGMEVFFGPVGSSSDPDVETALEGSIRSIGWFDGDGDGHAEVLVALDGHPDDIEGAGSVYIVPASPGAADLSAATAVLRGEEPGDAAASSLGPSDDLDGDGRPDLLVGAPRHGATGPRTWSMGRLRAPPSWGRWAFGSSGSSPGSTPAAPCWPLVTLTGTDSRTSS